ncbi:MAG: HupE/UreJ family protein [Boseongicola sp.]|nr:HupE/UreJ family protein [Boseongicola sp.]
MLHFQDHYHQIRVALLALLSTLLVVTNARAHEVQPTIADLTINQSDVEVVLDWVLEAPIAGLDLEGVQDINTAEGAEDYDALRQLPPAALETAFRDAWPTISQGIGLHAGDETLPLNIAGLTILDVENFELARHSQVILSAALPEGDTAVTLSWASEFGPIVVRQQGIENGYTTFLSAGGTTDPIPRTGGDDQTGGQAFVEYIGVGFDHIIPLGLDHILFVLGLFFLALRIGPLLWQISAFTLAHTVTLALGSLGIIKISPDIVEPLIAASIVYVGVENVLSRGLTPWRPFVIFAFGLLHGLGFASVLSDFGLGGTHFVPKLIGFNVGVEIGQIAVIAAAFVTLGLLFGGHVWWRLRIANPVSIAIAVIATFWVFERTGVIDPEGAFAPFAMLTEGGFASLWTTIVIAALAAVLTGAVLAASGLDALRDAAGIITSFTAFLGVVATFTSGAWFMTAVIMAIWILALRLQSLGGPDAEETA